MKTLKPLLIYSITILYLELISKLIIYKSTFKINNIYIILFSIIFINILTLFTSFFNNKTNKIILLLNLFILCSYYSFQLIFFKLFSIPFSFSTISLANQALDFTTIIKDSIINNFIILIINFIPFIIIVIINSKLTLEKRNKYVILSFTIISLMSFAFSRFLLFIDKNNYNSPYRLYYKIDDSASMIDTFGVLTYTTNDIKRELFGYSQEIVKDNKNVIKKETKKIEGEIIYGDNSLPIDYSSLTSNNKEINSLNQFFSQSEASKKNKYTSIFKNKNLIFILAEGFNEIAVDENRTPTLYKMIHSGFDFKSFYSPVFLSTTGGEFQATTGLIPTQETLKYWKNKNPYLAFSLGNVFNKYNYQVQSYHNWTYTYYKRNITMKTLGYNNYMGCGNGLEKRMNCKWLPYDSEMINVTIDDYINSDKFLTYYVTVSGHSPYNRNDNIARKYYNLVKDLPYSDGIKYYLAGQYELEVMLNNLISKLEESGKLDDTVIALVGDHYPYTLSVDEINEVSNYKKDNVVEINKSNLIIWNNKFKDHIEINKVGSQIDVLPTLLNLFGIEYDSRLLMGKDILSNYEGLAIFSNRSWVSDYGTYYSNRKKFIPKEGVNIDNLNDYVERINKKVENEFTISKMIIYNNYYKYVLNNNS